MSSTIVTTDQTGGHLTEKIRRYYTRYYRDQLGLPDWAMRVELRLNEENYYSNPCIAKVEQFLRYDFRGKSVLVVGAGTGGEALSFYKKGATVSGIEPDEDGYDILQEKVRLGGLDADKFKSDKAEALSFADNSFDFVYCWTVLEHVEDVRKSIDEMIRVCKPGGYVFIQVPDYRFPYEGHYKVILVPFAPKWVQWIYLKLRGRPTAFLSSINFLTTPGLNRICFDKNVYTIRAYEPLSEYDRDKSKTARFFKTFTRLFMIPKQQFLFLQKR
jgi:ubiquinone/menaquinone biosynthesis C-methylase UbiE